MIERDKSILEKDKMYDCSILRGKKVKPQNCKATGKDFIGL